MANDIGVYEAKTHLTSLLERVEGGEQFTITKHGRPVARLVPVTPRIDRERRRAAIARIKELSKGQTLDVPLKELINEGRP
jgi:prevent-host-death family protein